MPVDPHAVLPLKDLVFQVLLALAEGERHGWSLVKQLDTQGGGTRLLPGHFYRTVNAMIDDGLIEERDEPAAPLPARSTGGVAPRRFFRLTPFGRAVARAEATRLEALVVKSRARRLLRGRPR
jgi:DNA-binding PadR family transcriptional regulator